MRISPLILVIAALFIGEAGMAAAQGNVNNHPTSTNDWNAEVPKGWSTGGNAPLDYGSLYGGVPDGKRAAVLRSHHRLAENEFGTLMQTISADAYRGKRVRLSAMVSAEKSLSKGRIALWMRVNDATGRVTAFDDMQTGSIAAGTGWLRQEIVLDVPDQAASITFGILLAGGEEGCCWGRLAASDFRLQAVGGDVATTADTLASMPQAPVNPDFSE